MVHTLWKLNTCTDFYTFSYNNLESPSFSEHILFKKIIVVEIKFLKRVRDLDEVSFEITYTGLLNLHSFSNQVSSLETNPRFFMATEICDYIWSIHSKLAPSSIAHGEEKKSLCSLVLDCNFCDNNLLKILRYSSQWGDFALKASVLQASTFPILGIQGQWHRFSCGVMWRALVTRLCWTNCYETAGRSRSQCRHTSCASSSVQSSRASLCLEL